MRTGMKVSALSELERCLMRPVDRIKERGSKVIEIVSSRPPQKTFSKSEQLALTKDDFTRVQDTDQLVTRSFVTIDLYQF